MFVVITKPGDFHFQDKDDFDQPFSKPTHQGWLRFFFLANSHCLPFLSSASRSLLQRFHVPFLSKLKHWEDFLPECISVHFNHAKSHALGDHVLFLLRLCKFRIKLPQSHSVVTTPWLSPLTPPTEISMLIEKGDGESRHVFAVPLLSSDTARGLWRRDDGSFNLPSQHNWAACHEPHDLWCRQNVHSFFCCFTKGHRVVLDASISRCAAMLSHPKKNN